MKTYLNHSAWLLIFIIISISGTISSCSTSDSELHALEMAPISDLPADLREAAISVSNSYRFALANQHVLEQVPCYCGCGTIGHNSVYACFVKDSLPDGEVVFDYHASGCGICVDITLDAMRLTRQGKSPSQIKLIIDDTYAKFGISNMSE